MDNIWVRTQNGLKIIKVAEFEAMEYVLPLSVKEGAIIDSEHIGIYAKSKSGESIDKNNLVISVAIMPKMDDEDAFTVGEKFTGDKLIVWEKTKKLVAKDLIESIWETITGGENFIDFSGSKFQLTPNEAKNSSEDTNSPRKED